VNGANPQVLANVPGSPAEILLATWHDFNAVRRLEKVCFPMDAWPFWDIIGVLTLPDVLRMKAEIDGELVGFIAVDLRNRENLAWIAVVGVLPSYRRQGIAKALIKASETRLTVPYLRLSVRASNQAAQKLYEQLGYEAFDRWPRYYVGGEDAIVMQKRVY
jgi:ribosomal-protein-alanine N-acetyltransferase